MEKNSMIERTQFPVTLAQTPGSTPETLSERGDSPKSTRRKSEPCGICDGTGWAPVALSGGQRAVRRCSCWKLRIDLVELGIGQEHAGAQLSDFSPIPEVASAISLLLFGENQSGILVTGNVGTGKTRLLAAIVREFILVGRSVEFVLARSLLRRLWESFRDGTTETESAVLRHFTEIDFLAMDDVGREG